MEVAARGSNAPVIRTVTVAPVNTFTIEGSNFPSNPVPKFGGMALDAASGLARAAGL